MSHILIAGDSPYTRRQLVETLVRLGHTVVEARDTVDVLELQARERPTLIFADEYMPDMDGFEMISKIRARFDGTEGTPVALVPGKADESVRLRCEKLRAVALVKRPFEQGAIEDIVARLAGGTGRLRTGRLRTR